MGQRKWIRIGSAIGTGVAVVALFLVFVFAVRWFRADTSEQDNPKIDSIADVLTPDPISQAVIESAIDTESRIASLYLRGTGEMIGEAKRGEKDGVFYVELKTRLPEIDREKTYYQVWFLRKIPYDFFSAGEMITNDDGDFVLEWVAPDAKDYRTYTQIIITVNQYEGSSDPGAHLVEGEFGS